MTPSHHPLLSTLYSLLPFLLILTLSCTTLACSKGDDKKIISGVEFPAIKSYTFAAGVYPPYSYAVLDSNYTSVSGFDIDILDELAVNEGFSYEIVIMAFADALSALEKGKVDAVLSVMLTEEREKKFDFSFPTIDSGVVLVVNKDSRISGLYELRGKRVAVQRGSASEVIANEFKAKYNLDNVSFDDIHFCEEDVKQEISAAFFDDYRIAENRIQGGSPLRIVGDVMLKSQSGFAVAKGRNGDLLRKINAGLEKMTRDGRWLNIALKYFPEHSVVENLVRDISLNNKEYIIAADIYPPYSYLLSEAKYGSMGGFDIDILEAIAEEKNINYKVEALPFSTALNALKNGEVDALLTTRITEERKKIYDFSEPTIHSKLVFAVGSNNFAITALEDLYGKRVVVQSSTVGEDFARGLQSTLNMSIVTYDEVEFCNEDVSLSVSDGFFNDLRVLDYSIKQQGYPLRIINEPDEDSFYALAVIKGKNPELVEAFNEGLARLKEEGEWERIALKYWDREDLKDVLE